MSKVIEIKLLQKLEELHEEMDQLQEEIAILSIFIEKAQSECIEVNNNINNNHQLDRLIMVDIC